MTPEIIIDTVCEHFLMTRDELLSMNKRRFRDYVYPKQLTHYLMRQEFGNKKSLTWVGDYFFGQDHSMVIHACKTVENLRNKKYGNREYREHTDILFETFEKIKRNGKEI